ncbi:MAG: hypothetical protein AB7N71_01710 [Phycisphaerae bacterium]
MRKWMIGFFIGMSAAAVFGQSFNVDVDWVSGPGSSAPTNAFQGAAGMAGYWNGIGSSSGGSYALRNLANQPTPVSVSRTGSANVIGASNAGISGDDERLLEDVLLGSNGTTLNFTISNLIPGDYALYTYALNPNSQVTTIVNVGGSTSQADQNVGTQLFSPSYFVGATHGLHVVHVNAPGTLSFSLVPTGGGAANLAGFQLVQLNQPRLRMYVDDSANGLGHGASWANAFSSLVTALSTARVAGGQNTEMWVANGQYRPTTTTDRNASFRIPNHIEMYGGFAGSETSIDQRGLLLTYLNGNIGNTSLQTDNSYTVVVADLTAADTIIDGFRIHNGYDSDNGTVDGGHGGGMRLQGGSATIRNCTFVSNYSVDLGGGVYCDFGSPTFVDCFFYDNEAFRGSALYHSDIHPLKMYNCEFQANDGFEGTVYFGDSDGMIANSFFHGNYVGSSGGAIEAYGNGSAVSVINCTLAGNVAGQWVGGIYAKQGADVVLRNSILWENEAGFAQTPLEAQVGTSGQGSTFSYWANTIEGESGATGSNPLFVDGDGPDNIWGTFDDNCRLQAVSPAIDGAGNDMVPQDLGDLDQDGDTTEKLPLDFDFHSRVSGVVVDKGAFEFQYDEPGLIGDMNCDGAVTVSDIGPFVLALTNPGGYAAQFPNCDIENGDINNDGAVTVSDIGPFVALLTGV